MMIKSLLAALSLASMALLAQAPMTNLGYTDTPMLPGSTYRVHDPARPHPAVVTPGTQAGAPPSDAIVLFDGRDLSRWTAAKQAWKVENGYVEVIPNSGDMRTKDTFGDAQLHVEWAAPADIRGTSQDRGNSGIFLQARYEVQVLDSFDNPTYADGQAGAIYKQHKPLVNPIRKPGEWNVYDIVFNAPKFDEDGKLLKRATFTAFLNGVLVQDHVEVMGVTAHDRPPYYEKHADKLPLGLQDHGDLVRFRNIWVRPL